MPKYFAKSPPMTIVKVEIEEEFWIKNFGKKTNKKVEQLPKKFDIRKILMPKNFPKSPLMTIVKVEIEEGFGIKNFGKTTK